LGGDGEVGKSTAALQLSVAGAAGKQWFGMTPKPGPVVFLCAEDDADELQRRIEAIAENYGVGLADLGELHLIPLAGKDAVLATASKPGVIAATAVFCGLEAIVKRVKPRLVVLDVLADLFAGNEVNRSEARQFIGLLPGMAIDNDLNSRCRQHSASAEYNLAPPFFGFSARPLMSARTPSPYGRSESTGPTSLAGEERPTRNPDTRSTED
jgi:RecA-family ATPase